jgi:hypothetical protein
MDGASSMHGRDGKSMHNFGNKNPKVTDHFEDVGVGRGGFMERVLDRNGVL